MTSATPTADRAAHMIREAREYAEAKEREGGDVTLDGFVATYSRVEGGCGIGVLTAQWALHFAGYGSAPEMSNTIANMDMDAIHAVMSTAFDVSICTDVYGGRRVIEAVVTHPEHGSANAVIFPHTDDAGELTPEYAVGIRVGGPMGRVLEAPSCPATAGDVLAALTSRGWSWAKVSA